MARSALVLLACSLTGCAGMHASAVAPGADVPGSPKTTPVVARAAAPEAAPDPAEVKALADNLRGLLLRNLPDPLVENAPGWGRQKEGVVGYKFHKDGGRLTSEPVRGMKNDGTWRKVSVRAARPEQSLALGITDAAYPEPGKVTFTAMIGVDADIRFEQQVWRNGVRLYSGETRARCRAALALKCEATSRVEPKPGSLLPDVVFRLRATDAQLFYEDLVVEHTAGLGGDAARILGDAVIDTVKAARPDLERDLLVKANAAVVKAADTKDVRVSFDALLKGQVPGLRK